MLLDDGIHVSAIIHPDAKIGKNVSIGPYCIIGPNVEIGDECKIHSHTVIEGHTTIGNNNVFHSFCSIGAPPQDLSYKGEPTRVVIGQNNVFREYVSIHRGTLKDREETTIGNNSLFMAHVHLGHDVVCGDHCVFANSVNFGGHVNIGDRVIIGGGTLVSQFVTIGRGSYIGGASGLDRDIPLFCTAFGNRARLKGINIIGLKRMKYDRQKVTEVVDFYRGMEASAFSPRAFIDQEEIMKEYQDNEVITEMVEAIKLSKIGVAPFFVS